MFFSHFFSFSCFLSGQSLLAKHTNVGGNLFVLGYYEGYLNLRIRKKVVDLWAIPSLSFGPYHIALTFRHMAPNSVFVQAYLNGVLKKTTTLTNALGVFSDASTMPWLLCQEYGLFFHISFHSLLRLPDSFPVF
jgi:hypothetical protein